MVDPIRSRPGLRTDSRPNVLPAASAPPPAIQQSRTPIQQMDERFERDTVGGRNQAGKLLGLDQGRAGRGLEVSVHGINGSPKSMAQLQAVAAKKGLNTATAAYDDNYRRLTRSSDDLASNLTGWLRDNPGKPLQIDAHSMGSRVALGAVDRLQQQGLLQGRDVELNLMAPTLQGYDSANFARLAPPGAGLIKNVTPGKDMGTTSDFQRQIDAMQLPDNVKVRVFTGGRDDVVDAADPAFQRLVERLGARTINFPGADHDGVIDAAAAWLDRHD